MDIFIDDIKSYCIHMSIRENREENMYQQLNSFTNNYEIFEAIVKSPGYMGISASFKTIITEAKRLGYKQILIFEDDVYFQSKNSKEQFQKCINSLPSDWDILLGGIYSLIDPKYLEEDSINDCIKKIGDFSALHCTLINETAYDKFLSHDPSDIPHLDRYLGKLSENGELNTYVSYPMVAIQKCEYSDSGVLRQKVDYSSILNRFELLD